MKKLIPLLGLLLCFCFLANGQVLISKIQQEKLLFGPENVSVEGISVVDNWMAIIQEFQEEISLLSSKNALSIKDLEEQKRLKRRDQRKLALLQEENERIEEELTLAEELLQYWQRWPISATRQQATGKCLEVVIPEETEESSAALEVAFSDETLVTEFIPTEYLKPKKEWVKKKADRNCLSADPNDCLVWCLVEVKGGLHFVDYEGMTHQPLTCPVDFSYEEDTKSCVRKWRLVACQNTN